MTENKRKVKEGSILHYELRGQIVELTPDFLSVQLGSPITLTAGREVPDRFKEEVIFASEFDGEYYATEVGVNTAKDLLLMLNAEEEILLEDSHRLADVVKEYREKVTRETSLFEKSKILIEIQEKHFPELKETVITEEMIDEFYRYLTEVEGIEDIYAL